MGPAPHKVKDTVSVSGNKFLPCKEARKNTTFNEEGGQPIETDPGMTEMLGSADKDSKPVLTQPRAGAMATRSKRCTVRGLCHFADPMERTCTHLHTWTARPTAHCVQPSTPRLRACAAPNSPRLVGTRGGDAVKRRGKQEIREVGLLLG